MTNDEERPEWLRRCDAVNATEERSETYDNARSLPSDPLVILLVVTAYVLVYPFIRLYRWLRR